MKSPTRPAASRLGVAAAMPAETYEHRTRPVRHRVKGKPIKPKATGSAKPRAHRVGRSKR